MLMDASESNSWLAIWNPSYVFINHTTNPMRTSHQDSNGFRKFEAYAKIFFDRFDYYIPIVSIEGGAMASDRQDPRYPPVTDDDVTDLTLRAYHAMLDDAPAYYFAFTPWLLANGAGNHWDAAWEEAAWYKIDGSTLPVVQALKADPRRFEVRDWKAETDNWDLQLPDYSTNRSQPSSQPAMDALSTKIISATGRGPAWEVTTAQWQTAAGEYPRLYIDVFDASGRRLAEQQVQVDWTGGWTLLITERTAAHSASMPLTAPSDVYVVSLAGGSGQAVKARGAEGYDLQITFHQAETL
jgi:hypothetical protein